jgi:cytochrome P450
VQRNQDTRMSAIARIQDFDDPAYDPFISDEASFGDHHDPYPVIAQWLKQSPIHKLDYRVGMGLAPDLTMAAREHYVVLGYELVEKVLADPATFSNEAYRNNLGISFGRSVSTMDAPEHTRFRKIFQKAFLPNVVAKWGDELVDPVVNALMDQFIQRGKADLVQEFTHHYPFHIIYRQLALPQQDIKVFHKLAIAQTVISYDIEHGTEASRKLGVYFKALLDERRRNPGNDLVSLLAQSEADGEVLPEEVLVSFLRQLVNAGGDTTYRATSILLAGLLGNPDQLNAVRHDRALIPQAIDEALRWDGPVLVQSRTATRETELGGMTIPANAVLDVVAGSANRDPSRYPQPDKFDIFRARKHRHFAFAYGPHVCIGQHLARVEMTRALHAVLDRLPNLRLDPDMPPPDVRGTMMRVPKHIHVVFDR